MSDFSVVFSNNQTIQYDGDAGFSIDDKNGVLTIREGRDDEGASLVAQYSPSAWLTVRYQSKGGRGIIA